MKTVSAILRIIARIVAYVLFAEAFVFGILGVGPEGRVPLSGRLVSLFAIPVGLLFYALSRRKKTTP